MSRLLLPLLLFVAAETTQAVIAGVAGADAVAGLTYHVGDHGGARWRNGRVYDSDNGKHYACYVWLADADHLKLHGFVGIVLLGRTTTWRRVSDLQA